MNIFVSYRRDQAEDITGRITDRLGREQGLQVFLDVDNIPPGVDFREYLQEQVRIARVMLVVIGPGWVNARLHEPDDWVRIEVEAALLAGIAVIPVLVRGASIPKANDLPPTLRRLPNRQATRVDSDRGFHRQMGDLILAIKRIQSAPINRPQGTAGSAWTDSPESDARTVIAPSEFEDEEQTYMLDASDLEPAATESVAAPTTDWEADEVETRIFVGRDDPMVTVPPSMRSVEPERVTDSPIDSLQPVVATNAHLWDPPQRPPAPFRSFLPFGLGFGLLVPLAVMTTVRFNEAPTPTASSVDPKPSPTVRPAAAPKPVAQPPAAPAPVRTGFSLSSEPPGARVMIDGELVGVTPLKVEDRLPGVCIVRLEAEGYAPWEAQIMVDSGVVLELPPARLSAIDAVEKPSPKAREEPDDLEELLSGAVREPQTGTLRINSRPWSVVYIDGEPKGQTPQMNMPLPAGRHKVKLVNNEFGMIKSFSIVIREGEVTTKIIDLAL